MWQNIWGTLVFLCALLFTYLGWIAMDERFLGAVLGFILIAAPGFYYVYAEMPRQ